MTTVQLEDITHIESVAFEEYSKSIDQIMQFYEILKAEALTGNENAILLRTHIRDTPKNGSISIMQVHASIVRVLKREDITTIAEYEKLIEKIKRCQDNGQHYTRRFNKEIATESSGIAKIHISSGPSTPEVKFAPCGFDALGYFKSKPLAKNLQSIDLTDKEIMCADQKAQETFRNSMSMVADGPAYARRDMISYDILCLVQRQELIRRALNKDTYSSEDVLNLSREFHYNNIMIDVINRY